MNKRVESSTLTLDQAIKQLNDSVVNATFVILAVNPNDVTTLVRAYKQLRDSSKALEDVSKQIDKLKEKLGSETIPDCLENMGIDDISVGGYTFAPSEKMFASIPQDKKGSGFDWLRNNGLGALIQDHVDARSLSSAIKSFVADKGLMPPDEAISIHIKKTISVRKS